MAQDMIRVVGVRAQSEKYHRGDPLRQVDRAHRPVRFGQELPGV